MENEREQDAKRDRGQATAPEIDQTRTLADIFLQSTAALTQVGSTHRAETDLPPFDGTYAARQFFQAYDRKMDDALVTTPEKLFRLPSYLTRKPLELFRKLRMATQTYFQVRQTLMDLYPESNEASFAMKLAGQQVILETLTEGLPLSDQRLVRVVHPESLGEWFQLVQRIHGPSAPTSSHHEEQPPNMSGPYTSTPRRTVTSLISQSNMVELLGFLTADIRQQDSIIKGRQYKKLSFWISKYGFPEEFHPDNQPVPTLLNLSSTVLSPSQTEVLTLGLKYRPPTVPDIPRIISGVEPAISSLSHTAQYDIRSSIAHILRKPTPTQSQSPSQSQSLGKYRSLATLRRNHNIIITRSDKGSQTVVLDTADYASKMTEILSDRNTFVPITQLDASTSTKSFRLGLLRLKKSGHITPDQYSTFTSDLNNTPYIYGLPKTHKPDIPLRPIIAYHLSPAYKLSKYLTGLLTPWGVYVLVQEVFIPFSKFTRTREWYTNLFFYERRILFMMVQPVQYHPQNSGMEPSYGPRNAPIKLHLMQMKMILIHSELWDYANSIRIKPETEVESNEWEKNDQKALATIVLSLSPSEIIHVKRCKTSAEAWKLLNEVHQPKGPATKVFLTKQLILLKMKPNERMQDYLNKFSSLADNLPESYEGFRTAIETRDKLPNFETLKVKMLEEAIRQTELDGTTDSEEKVFLGTKWVFKTKCNSDGSVERHKARLVAKGYSQQYGIDYEETFAPVVRQSTIRMFLALAVEYNLILHQMDVQSAYLNGEIKEEIFMTQPENFVSRKYPEKVCRLKKAIYGLKQAGIVWHEKIDTELKNLGLKQLQSDNCVYIKHDEGILLVAIYVDDLIIAAEREDTLKSFKESMKRIFKIKDLGAINCCLGIRIQMKEDGSISIDQERYIEELLAKYRMKEAKPISTPMDSNSKLTKNSSIEVSTRPDIAYAVSALGQFSNDPRRQHWNAAKRVLRYLKGTSCLRITYRKSNEALHGYADADWGGNLVDRKSHTGIVYFLARVRCTQILCSKE
ncbi:hypothetical protein LAZ67_1002975 [Cordylochernes scorpioides]|uniref:Reverse transcriptase Ty1/copia-type domain-containing protein n=1 Tax=Cordylochernes scorpioides TaxID=51811 RepID=A0ABY6JWU5_9ARAC|nr:hypothetical protein LAZ67_1002975 [Cordylochernes scorpioides]